MSIQSLLEQMRTRQSDQTGPDTPAPLPSFTPSGLTIGPMGGTTPASYVSNISGQVDGLKNALMSSAKNLGSIASGLSNPGGLGGMAITSNAKHLLFLQRLQSLLKVEPSIMFIKDQCLCSRVGPLPLAYLRQWRICRWQEPPLVLCRQ
jgi:hypothetical protein